MENIWYANFPNDFTNLFPQIYSEFILNPDILFIGLNPSFPLKTITQRINNNPDLANLFRTVTDVAVINEENILEFYTYNPGIEIIPDYREIMSLERNIAIAKYSYYKPHREIANLNFFTWATYDLFQERNMNANNLPNANNAFNEFYIDQLEVLSNFLINLHPRLIIIANRQASRFFQPQIIEPVVQLVDEIPANSFDDILIVHNELNLNIPTDLNSIFQIRSIKINGLEPIPTIFSHQFTGGAFLKGVNQLHPFIINLLS